ncbi:MAG TPA: PsbP-related protein [Solirubrobacterales bacterium]|nr:PsbP-related protein [Solirubrobacterales bacterium]
MKATTTKLSISLVATLLVAGLLVAGCGGSSGSSSESTPSAPSTGVSAEAGTTESKEAGESGGGLPSEAQAAATGDIPDNQVFLVYSDPSAGYSIRYPEGWARKGSGNDVSFQEKANVIHLTVHSGSPQGKPGEKVTLHKQSAPDPVTGKSLPLTIDRYEYGKGGKVAVLELATPVGVDNVDAYKLISESFKWR